MTDQLHQTVFFDRHVALDATIVEFGGWNMPVQYPGGIVREHLATRRQAGLFDVSHMGRFIISGADALPFLQRVLTNNAAALEVGEAQYTIVQNENGGAFDDAYLYRFKEEEYLLVVNASNREKDWAHFQTQVGDFADLQMVDRTFEMAMLSMQGPKAKEVFERLVSEGEMPDPMRNQCAIVEVDGIEVWVARTGYTGEPICFELFFANDDALPMWDKLTSAGAIPVGLGARDTLRLEAALPLYGHELGLDPDGGEIPIYAIPLARFAVSHSPLKGDFIGRAALAKQYAALKRIMDRDFSDRGDLPRVVKAVTVRAKGIARAGSSLYVGGNKVGWITSGTMVPYTQFEGEWIYSRYAEEPAKRAICLALLDSDIVDGDAVEIEVRGKRMPGTVVPFHLRGEAPPYARPIPYEDLEASEVPQVESPQVLAGKAQDLLSQAIDNTRWRQEQCINLIPSEQSPSAAARMLSIMDPVCRYAEHKAVKAFGTEEVFYYQGTDFIGRVEQMVAEQIGAYLGCTEVENRVISGQMANMAVFSGLCDYINRADRKSEQRRIRKVMNHHIIRGGHLSSQPMGALRDYVARDPKTERPAVVNFPVLPENQYKIDVEAAKALLAQERPELVILGKSMILHKEPVAEMRAAIDDLGLDTVLMFDMAHVLGLAGPHYQEPFKEGADLVTGSTHKTYFGTQRGIVAGNYREGELGWDFWEAINRRAFPGSTSNHHLGTLLGLLMSAYEMNAFKDEYQAKVVANAKAFAMALQHAGLDVCGDPQINYTETHQVVVAVGYAKGPEIARRLETNGVVVNYQASPEEEGFTASGSLRLGVSEMTRFGMEAADFETLAGLMRDCIVDGKEIKDEVATFRQRFMEMRYCFKSGEFDGLMQQIHSLV